jgi:hypothetical protein
VLRAESVHAAEVQKYEKSHERRAVGTPEHYGPACNETKLISGIEKAFASSSFWLYRGFGKIPSNSHDYPLQNHQLSSCNDPASYKLQLKQLYR